MENSVVTDTHVKQILQHLLQHSGIIGESNRNGVIIVDTHGIVRFVNPMWARMHGYNTNSELVGKNISMFHTKEQMESDIVPIIDEARNREQIDGPIAHLRSDGVVFCTETKIIPVKDEHDHVIGFVILAVGDSQNNSFNHTSGDQIIKPIKITNDIPNQYIAEKIEELEMKKQNQSLNLWKRLVSKLLNAKREPKQSITGTSNEPAESAEKIIENKTASESIIAEHAIQPTKEKYTELIENKESGAMDEIFELSEKPQETAFGNDNIDMEILRTELEEKPEYETTSANVEADKKEKNENMSQSKDIIKTPYEAEEKGKTKVELEEKHPLIENGINTVPVKPVTEKGLLEAANNEKPHEISLRDTFYILFRHKWKMVSFFLLVMAIIGAVTFLSDKIYRSEAKLLLRIGRENSTLDPTAATGHIVSVIQSRENEINSELEILKSQELIEKVVDSIGVQEFLKSSDKKAPLKNSLLQTVIKGVKSLPDRFGLVEPIADRDRVILKVAKDLKVENLKDSSIINISYEAKEPKLAQEVVSKLIDLHREKHIAIHRTLGSPQFFDQQANLLREKLVQSENELRNFKNEVGVSSVAEQQRVVLGRIGTLKQEIDQTDAALAFSMATVNAVQRIMNEVPKMIVTEETKGFPNYRADEMRKQLFERQLEELKLLTNFTEESGTVKAIRKEIAEAQALFDKEEPNRTQITQGISKAYEQLQSILVAEQANTSSLKAKIDVQRKQLVDTQGELKTLNDAETKIALLTREVNIQETNYRKYSENLEQARINYAMEGERISNISVVQSALFPSKAIKPNKLLNLILGLFLGVLGGLVLAIFSEHLDHSIKTVSEAEESLQLPTLAFIPQIRLGKTFPVVKLKKQINGKSRIPGKTADIDTPARIRKYYDTFVERLLLNSNGFARQPYVLAVIGCKRHEGVSAVAANLAATISRYNKNSQVLLVDANLKHPCIHKVFSASLSPGLSDILVNGQNSADAIQSISAPNVNILTAGSSNGNVSEALDYDKFAKMLQTLKGRYNFVVVDIPALNETSSAVRLASLCDSAVLVVQAERSRREVMQRAKAQLEDANVNILGVVLNKKRFYVPGWLYQRL